MFQSRQNSFKKSQNRQIERIPKQEMTCTFGSRKKYEQDSSLDDREPNFGTKRSHNDKKNQIFNFQHQNRSQKFLQKVKPQSSAIEIEKDQRWKKYAYIKNSNSLNNPQRYSQNQNDQKADESYETQRKKQKFRQSVFSSQEIAQRTSFISKDEEIDFLKQSLQNQREKFQALQQQTIKNQMKILDTISNLEGKLKELKFQNLMLSQQNAQLKAEISNGEYEEIPKFRKHNLSHVGNASYLPINEINTRISQLNANLNQKILQLQTLEHDYKKIKGVAKGIVDMMNKVDHIQTPVGQDQIKFAWKWVKKVVWEYEAIRKKAFEWKKAYDELNKDSENEGSVTSEEGY